MPTPHLNEDDIERYALGKLPAAETAPAEEHLLVCPRCRDEFELLGLIIAGLREGSRRTGDHGRACL